MKTIDITDLADVHGGIGLPTKEMAEERKRAAAHPNRAANTCIKQAAVWGTAGAIAGSATGAGAVLGAIGGAFGGCVGSLVH